MDQDSPRNTHGNKEPNEGRDDRKEEISRGKQHGKQRGKQHGLIRCFRRAPAGSLSPLPWKIFYLPNIRQIAARFVATALSHVDRTKASERPAFACYGAAVFAGAKTGKSIIGKYGKGLLKSGYR